MNKKTFFQRNLGIPIGVIASVLITASFLISIAISQQKSPQQLKQDQILDAVPFNRVVQYTLIAAERNYRFRERLIPQVHQNDYFTVILNTAKRLAIADSVRVSPQGLQRAAIEDTTKNKEK